MAIYELNQSQRETVLLALSYLQAARPSWDHRVRELVDRLNGRVCYGEFRACRDHDSPCETEVTQDCQDAAAAEGAVSDA